MFKANKFLAIIALFLFVLIMESCGGGGSGGGGGGSTGPQPPATENFTLSVDKFGDGIVTSNLSGINCGNDCSESYPSGTTVVLAAIPNSGYQFSSWSGCDSVSDNTCTIIMNGNKIVLPTFALSEFKLQSTTKILDDATMQYLVRQEGTTYYFDPQATVIRELIPSDVILSKSGRGFLRRVQTVSIADGLIVVETSDASLEDAIEKGSVTFTKTLTHADLALPVKLIKGVSLHKPIKAESLDFTFYIDTTIPVDGIQIKIKGNTTTSFETDFAISYDKIIGIPTKLKELKTVLITKNTQTLSVGVEGSIINIDKKIRINQTPLIFGPFLTPIGPLFIEVDVYLGIKGNAQMTLSTQITEEIVYTAGIYYNYLNEPKWGKISNYSKNFGTVNLAPNISASAYIKPYLRPEVKFFLLDVLGPYAYLDGFFKLEGGVASYPWWRISGGVDASLGAKIEVDTPLFSWTVVGYNVDWNILEWEIASSTTQNQSPVISSVTANPSTVLPNGTSTVTCNASDPDNDPLTYSWSTTGGSISGSGSTVTWTAPSTVGNYTVTCSVSDGKGGTSSKGVNISVTESTTPLSITTTSLPSGTVGVSYATNLSATGGKPPYTWSWSGNTPLGLSLNSGIISGTPTTAGTYNFTVKVTDSSSPQQTSTRDLFIVINSPTTSGVLQVTPSDGLVSSGSQGGPFSPSSKTYTLSNTGGTSINWTTSKGQSWVSLSSTSGTLSPGGSATVTVSINSNANSLTPGSYSDTVSFTNTTNGNGNTSRTVSLTVSTGTTYLPAPSLSSPPNGGGNQSTTPTFIWSAVSGATSYRIMVATNPSSLPTDPTIGTCSSCVINDTTSYTYYTPSAGLLSPGTTYYWQVHGRSSTQYGYWSSKWSFTTASSGCTLPGNFTLNANAYCNTTPPAAPAVMLTWTASSGASYYDVYRNGTLYYSGVTGTSFDNNANVVAGQTYTYYVVAKNSCGTTQSNTVTVTVPSNICPSTPTERITNGSFSSGTSGWTLAGDFWAGTTLSNYRTSPGYAAGGVDSSGYAKNNAYGYMYQTVTIPSNATSATLSFWYNITSDETGSTPYDVLNVTIQNSSGSYLATVAIYSNVNKGTVGVYNQKIFDVTSYKGQTIRVHFLATTNSSNYTVFRIDDVSLMADGN